MAGTVKDFRDLRVYQSAFESAMEVFTLSRRWPKDERYSLTDQICRASRSVCSNIAEGWRKRRHQASFISKLSDSDAEAAETIVWLEFAKRCGYLTEDNAKRLIARYDQICAQLVKPVCPLV